LAEAKLNKKQAKRKNKDLVSLEITVLDDTVNNNNNSNVSTLELKTKIKKMQNTISQLQKDQIAFESEKQKLIEELDHMRDVNSKQKEEQNNVEEKKTRNNTRAP